MHKIRVPRCILLCPPSVSMTSESLIEKQPADGLVGIHVQRMQSITQGLYITKDQQWAHPRINRNERNSQTNSGPWRPRGLVVVQYGKESDLVAIRELRLVGRTLLENQVAAAIGSTSGIGADRPETGTVQDSELEGRKRFRGRISCGLKIRRSVPRSSEANGSSVAFQKRVDKRVEGVC